MSEQVEGKAEVRDADRRPVPKIDVEELFTYHPPVGDQAARYVLIRQAAKELARVIVRETPAGADQSAAIRKLRECVMTANAAIALEGRGS